MNIPNAINVSQSLPKGRKVSMSVSPTIKESEALLEEGKVSMNQTGIRKESYTKPKNRKLSMDVNYKYHSKQNVHDDVSGRRRTCSLNMDKTVYEEEEQCLKGTRSRNKSLNY